MVTAAWMPFVSSESITIVIFIVLSVRWEKRFLAGKNGEKKSRDLALLYKYNPYVGVSQGD
jgi:hypothetical protein